MKKTTILLAIIIFVSGCASKTPAPVKKTVVSLPKESPQIKAVEQKALPAKKNNQQAENQQAEEAAQEVINGMIFGKTEFEGVLKKEYVDLYIQNSDAPDNKYILHVGGDTVKKSILFETKQVRPGYFYLELPAGDYTITDIAIPVGTTEASEKIDIAFTVYPDEVTYVGTLNVVGTKERIKVGVTPLLAPGFEYAVNVINGYEFAIKDFYKTFPDYDQSKKIKLNLLKVQSTTPPN